jgi:deazaflavin-dependent oxidoreductase (nitroreductase family)
MSDRYIKPDWFTRTVFNPFVALMTRAGVSVWGSRVLRVRGRKSGEWRSSPVNLLTFEGKRYLVAPRGNTHWVRNIRASHEAELWLGSKVELIRVTEVPDADRVPILRAYLKKWFFEVGVFFGGVKADSPESELTRIAPDHPVFLIRGPHEVTA